MSTDNSLFEIGYIAKAHGIKGELKLKFTIPNEQIDINKLKVVFIGKVENPLPYSLKSINVLQKQSFHY